MPPHQLSVLISGRIEPSTVNIEPASATDLDDHKEDILKALKSSTSDITSNIHDHATALKDMHEQNLAVVNTYTSQQIMEHENTRVEVKRLSISFEEHQAIMAAKLAETQDIVDHAREQDMVEHKKTRFVMESEIAEIKGWIRSLKQQEPKVEQDVKDGIIEYAIRAPTSSPSELQNLKVITNAKFSLWTALQDLLEKLQVQSPTAIQTRANTMAGVTGHAEGRHGRRAVVPQCHHDRSELDTVFVPRRASERHAGPKPCYGACRIGEGELAPCYAGYAALPHRCGQRKGCRNRDQLWR